MSIAVGAPQSAHRASAFLSCVSYVSDVESGLGFDTRAAIDAGTRVAEELRSEPQLPVNVGD